MPFFYAITEPIDQHPPRLKQKSNTKTEADHTTPTKPKKQKKRPSNAYVTTNETRHSAAPSGTVTS
jgi:hypothetical protein